VGDAIMHRTAFNFLFCNTEFFLFLPVFLSFFIEDLCACCNDA